MYNCLPMYHSVGGVQAPGAVLVAGGASWYREQVFSQPLLERYPSLGLHAVPIYRRALPLPAPRSCLPRRRQSIAFDSPAAMDWPRRSGTAFKDRFRIPRILEFYAATEGGVSLFNVQGKRGAIGHIPRYLAHRFSPALVRFDFETGEPARDEQGFCIRCGPNQPGEALGKVVNDPANVGSRFEGYTEQRGFGEENPSQCFRARRCLGSHRRPDAER